MSPYMLTLIRNGWKIRIEPFDRNMFSIELHDEDNKRFPVGISWIELSCLDPPISDYIDNKIRNNLNLLRDAI